MSMTIWRGEPPFPVTEGAPGAQRYLVGPYVVDSTQGEPTLAEVEAILSPPTPQQIIDQAFPQTGTARVLFEALFELANDVRDLRSKINVLAPGTYSAGQAGQITRAQLKSWLESKLP
jgi:hypothetical protein